MLTINRLFPFWAIAHALGMPPDLAVGMVLVGSVASGAGSTVMVFLSGGDVALSVTISALSTLVGVVATPLLTRLYVSAGISVDVLALLVSILQIVALPVALGLIVNRLLRPVVRRVQPTLPLVSMVSILAIIGAVVAGSQASSPPWPARYTRARRRQIPEQVPRSVHHRTTEQQQPGARGTGPQRDTASLARNNSIRPALNRTPATSISPSTT